jgi:indolepyruvate ferredoxin oxidoreductase beta subunit
MIHQMGMDYPSLTEIHDFLKNVSSNIFFMDGEKIATDLGNVRTMNVVMLGALIGLQVLPLKKETLEKAILSYLPSKFHDINKKAFELGIEKGIELRGSSND